MTWNEDISRSVSDTQSRYFKPIHGIFLTLTKWSVCLNPTSITALNRKLALKKRRVTIYRWFAETYIASMYTGLTSWNKQCLQSWHNLIANSLCALQMSLRAGLLSVRYVWRATDWGECRILPLLSQQDRRQANISILCGGGIQTRKTYCVQVPDDSAPHHRKEGKEICIHRRWPKARWKHAATR